MKKNIATWQNWSNILVFSTLTVCWDTFGSILSQNFWPPKKGILVKRFMNKTFVVYALSRSWFVFYRCAVSSFWQGGTFQYCFCATRAFFNQIFSRTREKNKAKQKTGIQFLLTIAHLKLAKSTKSAFIFSFVAQRSKFRIMESLKGVDFAHLVFLIQGRHTHLSYVAGF